MIFSYAQKYYDKRIGKPEYVYMALILHEACKREGFTPISMMDVGCACGNLLNAYSLINKQATLTGIDCGSIPFEKFIPKKVATYIDVDLDTITYEDTLGSPACNPLAHTYDVVTCIEVAEHIDPNNSKGLVEFLATSTNHLLFLSPAGKRQKGYGHCNCQHPNYWITLCKSAGLELLHRRTRVTRKHMKILKAGNYNNMLVFKKGDDNDK